MDSLVFVYSEVRQWYKQQGLVTRIVFWIWLVAIVILLALWVTH
jgi:hypothetical protein